ncbi:MAG: AzlD domain-containing protein [Chlamydiales bacterium]|nr:AzlD domain-containing protein [Chlamydiales bacterium]
MKMWYSVLPFVAAISLSIRILPFIAGPFLKRFAFLERLALVLPSCLLILITAHSLPAQSGLPEVAALGIVIIMQYFFRKLVLSMLVGMLTHQILMLL